MELGEWLARGLQVTWRYKSLWIFGFLAALGAGGTPSFQGNFQMRGPTSPMPLSPGFQQWLERNWPFLALALLGLFLLSLLIQLVALWGQGALILGGGEAAEGRSPALGALARRATARLLRLIGIMVLLGVPGFLVTFIFLLGAIGGFLLALAQRIEGIRIATLILIAFMMLALLGCLLLLGWVLHLWSRLALRAALLEDLPWLSALRRGFQIGLRRIIPLLLVWLVLDVGVLGVTAFVLSLLTAVPLLALLGAGFLALFGGGRPVEPSVLVPFVLTAVLAAFCLTLFSRILLAPVITFVETSWTMAYRAWVEAGTPAAGEAGSVATEGAS
ncbi:MAG TPA: hypothetical protein VNK89_14150 [Thermoflexus sp.]|nr:hypothetical protein [Thermoflexus sp.]